MKKLLQGLMIATGISLVITAGVSLNPETPSVSDEEMYLLTNNQSGQYHVIICPDMTQQQCKDKAIAEVKAEGYNMTFPTTDVEHSGTGSYQDYLNQHNYPDTPYNQY